MRPLGISWKTNLTGIAAIVAAVSHALTGLANGTPVDWSVVITGISTGIGLMFARDNKVTSEQVGVTPTANPQGVIALNPPKS